MKLDASDVADLRPIIAEVVGEVLREVGGTALASGQIGFTEKQAAQLVGLAPHQLRDARLRGDIAATVLPGLGSIMYSRRALVAFVEGNERLKAKQKPRGKK